MRRVQSSGVASASFGGANDYWGNTKSLVGFVRVDASAYDPAAATTQLKDTNYWIDQGSISGNTPYYPADQTNANGVQYDTGFDPSNNPQPWSQTTVDTNSTYSWSSQTTYYNASNVKTQMDTNNDNGTSKGETFQYDNYGSQSTTTDIYSGSDLSGTLAYQQTTTIDPTGQVSFDISGPGGYSDARLHSDTAVSYEVSLDAYVTTAGDSARSLVTVTTYSKNIGIDANDSNISIVPLNLALFSSTYHNLYYVTYGTINIVGTNDTVYDLNANNGVLLYGYANTGYLETDYNSVNLYGTNSTIYVDSSEDKARLFGTANTANVSNSDNEIDLLGTSITAYDLGTNSNNTFNLTGSLGVATLNGTSDRAYVWGDRNVINLNGSDGLIGSCGDQDTFIVSGDNNTVP